MRHHLDADDLRAPRPWLTAAAPAADPAFTLARPPHPADRLGAARAREAGASPHHQDPYAARRPALLSPSAVRLLRPRPARCLPVVRRPYRECFSAVARRHQSPDGTAGR